MKFRFLASRAGVLSLALAASAAHAQFYAPDTEFHDRAQRHFPVELARVLAWRDNQSAGKIAEVTYEVGVAEDRQVTWKIHWRDEAGGGVRDAEVHYPESALGTGAAWYRDVARQLTPPDVASGAANEADLLQAYWKGAEAAGASRAASLQAAFALAPGKEPARAAGLLAHAALPSVAGGVSLDSVLLARAAAWLCLAEQSARAGKSDAPWAPILFLAGRENDARDAWKKSPPGSSARPLERWWGFLLSRPRARDAFVFAADPQYRPWAFPLLVYEAQLLRLGEVVAEAAAGLFPNEKSMAAQHDYGPFLTLETGIGGGRLVEGAWPAISRQAWLDCLRKFRPEPLDFHDYAPLLGKLPATPAAGAEDDEASLAGLATAAPLLNLGFTAGDGGKLIPVAIATARDLLNFGWEMNGLQLGARWNFVTRRWGVRSLGAQIAKATLDAVDGAEVFFYEFPYGYNSGRPPEAWKGITRERVANYARLQEIDGDPADWVVPFHSFSKDKAENALAWLRRCWLRPALVLNQSRELYFANKRTDIAPLLRRLAGEGGLLISGAEIQFFVYGLTPTGVKECPGTEELRQEPVRAQPEASSEQLTASWGKFDAMPALQAAQEREKIFWQRPGSDLPYPAIFSDYLRAHAYQSAKRFYTQAEGVLDDTVGFSNTMGPARFTLALLEKDEPAIRESLSASNTGSGASMVMDIMLCVEREDYKALAQIVDGSLERYPPEPGKETSMSRLKGFLPLIPALKDPASPDHGKALDYFGAYNQWPTLQWFMVQRAKLSTEEAVRFLGGKDADPERRMMVAYLLKDKALFAQTYDQFQENQQRGGPRWQNMGFVVIHTLRNELLEVPAPAEQPDLKPPGAQSLRQAFAASLKR